MFIVYCVINNVYEKLWGNSSFSRYASLSDYLKSQRPKNKFRQKISPNGI